MTATTDGKFRIEKKAPEGGWGYLIAIGLALPFACSLGSLGSFGLMFNDFLNGLGAGTSAVTVVNGAFFSALSFGSLFSTTLFKQFSMRSVGICGAIIYFLGSVMTIFVTSVEHLIVSFGVLQGAGLGLCAPVGYTIFNHYFVERRVFVMGIAQALKGIGIMSYPIIVQFFMDKYGFRGTMAIIAAINGHVIFGMLVMHPVEWHLIEVRVPINENEPLMDSNETEVKVNTCDEDEISDVTKTRAELKKKISVPERVSNSFNDDAIYRKLERSKSLDPSTLESFEGFDPIRTRLMSITSLGDMGGDALMTETYDRVKKGKLKKLVDFLDLTLFKDLVYVNMVLGASFALYADNAFFTLLPMYLFEQGFSKPQTALVVATGAAADLSSRVFLAVMSLFYRTKARNVIWMGTIATILVRFVFLNASSYIGVSIVVAVLGFLRTWLHVPISLIFAEYLPQDRFPAGYGLFMFFQGNFAFLVGPFIGWIRDMTKSYVICFNSLTFIMTLCTIPWAIEKVWLRMHPRQSIRDDNSNVC